MTILTSSSWVMLALYLIMIVFISVISYKRVQGLDDFVAAPRSYNWVVLGFTQAAAYVSAATFLGQPGIAYNVGFPSLWFAIGYPLSGVLWAIAAYKIWEAGTLSSVTSIPEFMGKRFNSKLVQGIAAIIILGNITYLAGQYAGLGWLFQTALGVPYFWGMVIAASVTVAYVMIGGSHSDILTATIQGVLMTVVALIVFVGGFLLVKEGGPVGVNNSLVAQNPGLGWGNIFSPISPMFAPFSAISIAVAVGFGGLSPQMSKNFLALNNKRDMGKMILLGTFLMGILGFLMFGGIGVRALVGGSLTKSPDLAIPTLISSQFTPILGGLLSVGILAAIMSTANALYLIISTAVAKDLYRDILAPKLHPEISQEKLDKRVLLLTRLLIPVIAFLGIYISYPAPPYLSVLIWVGFGAVCCALSPVMVLSAAWKGVTRVAAASSMTITLVVYIYLLFALKYHPFKAVGIGLLLSIGLLFIISLISKPSDQKIL